jgi:hypothetical protein
MSTYKRKARDADRPSGNLASVRKQFDALFKANDVHDQMSGKPLRLPVENIRHEIHGDPVKDPENCMVALRLDTLNGGPLTLLVDWSFWYYTLRLLKNSVLYLEDGRVFIGYRDRAKVDQWLGHLITGRRMDWHSVRATEGESVINYRRAALEVRQNATQKIEDERLKVTADFNTENPTYPMTIGDHTVALGGTTQETAGNVNPDKPSTGKIVGLYKYRDKPKTTVFGKRVSAGHADRAGVNKGDYDQLQMLTDALMDVPTETRDSGVGS